MIYNIIVSIMCYFCDYPSVITKDYITKKEYELCVNCRKLPYNELLGIFNLKFMFCEI